MKVDGLLGLMWRTWETAPQISALAQSGWTTEASGTVSPFNDEAFYSDFCAANFGAATSAVCTKLFLAVDGWTVAGDRNSGTKLDRSGQACCGGPMNPAHVEPSQFLDISGFDGWLATVTGVANLERATAWVNLFRYHLQTQIVANLSAAVMFVDSQAASPFPTATMNARDPAATATAAADVTASAVNLEGAAGLARVATAAEWGIREGGGTSGGGGGGGSVGGGCKPDTFHAKCYVDKNTCTGRTINNCAILPYTAWIRAPQTQESCAVACARQNYTVAGVEFATACFCGNPGWENATTQELPLSDCAAMKCSNGEPCGGGDIMLVYPFFCTSPLPPPGPVPPRPPPPPGPAQRAGAKLLMEAYAKMITLLLEFTTTPGELGMLAAHEGANWPSKFGKVPSALGMSLNQTYVGTPRIYRPAIRTVIAKTESSFYIEAAVLSAVRPASVTLHVGKTQTYAMVGASDPDPVHGGGGGIAARSQVYSVEIPVPADDFEYTIVAAVGGATMATPSIGTQSVVVV